MPVKSRTRSPFIILTFLKCSISLHPYAKLIKSSDFQPFEKPQNLLHAFKPQEKNTINVLYCNKQNTLMAIICSGVGATTLGVRCSSSSETFRTSTGVNVFIDSFLASSSISFEANRLAASILSYQQKLGTLKINIFDSCK